MKDQRIKCLMVCLVMSASTAVAQDLQDEYDKFVNDARKEYQDFRKQCLDDYIDFVRHAWKEYGVEPPVAVPKVERVMPMLADDADVKTASWFGDMMKRLGKNISRSFKRPERKQQEGPIPYKEIVEVPKAEQPQPLAEVVEDSMQANDYYSFTVFGTKCRVRFGENCRFTLQSVKEDDVANAMLIFKKPQFDNMLYDCLEERKHYNFSDWAYYKMLKKFTDEVYGQDTNEATLVLSFLFSSSGYKVRMVRKDTELYMVTTTNYHIFRRCCIPITGEPVAFYELSGRLSNRCTVDVCEAKFPKEGSLSLQISAVQELDEDLAPQRTITSKKDEDFSFTVKLNKNYIDFVNTYPRANISGKPETVWALYANTPMDKSLAAQLYPQIRAKLKGMSKTDAINQLLWWIQYGLTYEYDEKLWGEDRIFFAEESLYYPFCDCEDRAILFSRLVRDLLKLDVVLLYYANGVEPDTGAAVGGHLAAAVRFSEEDGVSGDYFTVKDKSFYVCDPTFYGGRIGDTMYYYVNTNPSIISLD